MQIGVCMIHLPKFAQSHLDHYKFPQPDPLLDLFKPKLPRLKLSQDEIQRLLATLPPPPPSPVIFANILYIQRQSDPADFRDKLNSALKTLLSEPCGRKLLLKIAFAKHSIRILYDKDSCANPTDLKDASIRGVGTGSTIFLSDKPMSVFNSKKEYIDMPFFIRMAHELIHACHNAYGTRREKTTCDRELWTSSEEFYTIAREKDDVEEPSQYAKKPKISENAIRKEHNLAPRLGHHGIDTHLALLITSINSSLGYSKMDCKAHSDMSLDSCSG